LDARITGWDFRIEPGEDFSGFGPPRMSRRAGEHRAECGARARFIGHGEAGHAMVELHGWVVGDFGGGLAEVAVGALEFPAFEEHPTQRIHDQGLMGCQLVRLLGKLEGPLQIILCIGLAENDGEIVQSRNVIRMMFENFLIAFPEIFGAAALFMETGQ